MRVLSLLSLLYVVWNSLDRSAWECDVSFDQSTCLSQSECFARIMSERVQQQQQQQQ